MKTILLAVVVCLTGTVNVTSSKAAAPEARAAKKKKNTPKVAPCTFNHAGRKAQMCFISDETAQRQVGDPCTVNFLGAASENGTWQNYGGVWACHTASGDYTM